MSSLPSGWVHAELGQIISIRNGYAFKSEDFKKGGSVPVVKQSNLTGSEVDLTDCAYVSEEVANSAGNFRVCKGDLLLGMSGSIGEPSFYLYDTVAAQNQRTGLVQFAVYDSYHRHFVKAALIAHERQYISRGKGIGVLNVSANDIEQTTIALPPLSEQRRIVAKIDSLTGKSRRARDHLDHIPRLVEKYKQAVLAAAFRGELTREWRGSALDLPESNEAGELWSVPPGWRWRRVGEIGKVSLGRQRSPANHNGPHMRPYVRAANITWQGWDFSDVKEMNFDEHDYARFQLKAGDVLVNEGSGSAKEVGKPAIWRGAIANCCFQNTLIRVQPQECSSEYLYWYFLLSALAERFVASTQGVNIYHIGKDGLARFLIPQPPAEEQDEIVRRIETAFAWIDRLASEATSARRLIDRLDQTVLSKAFRGELVPQDAEDEPASMLLERIRAERGAAPKATRGQKATA